MKLAILIRIFCFLCFAITMTLAKFLLNPGCPKKCGNVTIPYPFGIGSECSANSSFTVFCQNFTSPPTISLSAIKMEVLNISLSGTVTVNQAVSPLNCSVFEQRTTSLPISLEGSPFTISPKNNSLAVLGCKNSVWLRTNKTAVGGCTALCDRNSTDTSCNGVNCCQIEIPSQLKKLQFTYKSNEANNNGFCGYVFPVDHKWLQMEYKGGILPNLFVPLVLEWEFDLMKGDSYNKSVEIGAEVGGVILVIVLWRSSLCITKLITTSLKRKYFKRNGGLLFEQHLSATENGLEKTKLFSSSDLERATDHYNENRVLGCGGQGTVYKAMLANGRIVAVKKSKRVENGDLEVFINEVVILSQINHRNVVKLLGCCLETEVPRLVYEFIPNGTLFQHIHDPSEEFPLTWEIRVRIAREVAGALAYLHSSSSAPIYHRDIKSTNILLDDKYRAKVADFGTSRSVSIDQTHLTTKVVGTFGYMDPEYFRSSQFTEKSDVYSFGVVMVELLTGEKAISAIRVEMGRGLATHFLHSMEENQLFEILDARVLEEGEKEEIAGIAELARRCLNLNGRRRPTMKEVAVELEGIQMLKEGSEFLQNESKERNSIDFGESGDFSSISESMHFDSITTCIPNVDVASLSISIHHNAGKASG